ncbi:MAG: TlyA family RNA methyltransferase [Acidimicrobiales bacterium]
MARRRLDAELVRRGLAASREQARTLVESVPVLVHGAPADKPARLVGADEPVVVTGPGPRFVSRGGEKLDAALTGFAIDVAGERALDAGASTGGFTDCLLQRGAALVTAVDVGYGQFAPALRSDPRVRLLERTNIRDVRAMELGGPFEVVVADLSFISLTTVAPGLAGELATAGATIVVLVKPQFEAGRAEVSRGRGVVRDAGVRLAALEQASSALEAAGASIMGAMPSPLVGPAGNAEYLLYAVAHRRPDGALRDDALQRALADAVAHSPDAGAG